MTSSTICEERRNEKLFGLNVSTKFLDKLKNDGVNEENIQETFYRSNGKSVEKIIEYHPKTKVIVKVTYYDYFNSEKVKSIEEFDPETGVKTRLTNFTLFKSVTDYDLKTGHKIKTTNFDIKNPDKKTSVYDFDIESEKVIRVSIFRPDGQTVSVVKEIDPNSGMVKRTVNYKKDSTAISSVSKFDFQGDKTVKTTFYYNTPMYFTSPAELDKKVIADSLNKKVLDSSEQKRITKLLDNLYKNKMSFSSIST